jgi:hypothetical protein
MTKYPSMRFAVINGELKDEKITGPEQEREGWETSPHRFRALTVRELMAQGNHPDKAAELHERELRRVKHIFAGNSLEESEVLADAWHPLSLTAEEADALRSENAVTEAKLAQALTDLANKQTEMDQMKADFKKQWTTLIAERDFEIARAKGKKSKAAPDTE